MLVYWERTIVACQAHPALVKQVKCWPVFFCIFLSGLWVPGPCLVAARSQGGSLETLPRWHVTIIWPFMLCTCTCSDKGCRALYIGTLSIQPWAGSHCFWINVIAGWTVPFTRLLLQVFVFSISFFLDIIWKTFFHRKVFSDEFMTIGNLKYWSRLILKCPRDSSKKSCFSNCCKVNRKLQWILTAPSCRLVNILNLQLHNKIHACKGVGKIIKIVPTF